MLRRLIIAVASVSALGISFCRTDILAASRTTRAAVAADNAPNWDVTAAAICLLLATAPIFHFG